MRATAKQLAAATAANPCLSTAALLAEGCGARFGGRGKVTEGVDGAIAAWCGGLTAAGDGDAAGGVDFFGVGTGEVAVGEGE